MTREQILTFLQAGNATFTLKSLKTGEHFTYQIKRGFTNNGQNAPLFVRLGVGYDMWIYLGLYRPGKRFDPILLTEKSHFTKDAPSVRALRWYLERLLAGNLRSLELVEFKHAGKCGRCGRVLTHPESIDSGLGPECAARAGVHFSGPQLGLASRPVPVEQTDCSTAIDNAIASFHK